MSLTRRSFLLGAGTIITASFVKEVANAVADTRSPWLITPPQAAKAIYYEPVEDHWRLHLGQPAFEIPKPHLLIDNLRWHGHLLDTQDQIDDRYGRAFVDAKGVRRDFDYAPYAVRSSGGFFADAACSRSAASYSWEDQWEHNLSPEAQAYTFLQKHDLFPADGKGRREGQVIFESFPNPMSSARWVEVYDPLSLSLLQARLNELSLNTEVRAYA